MASRYYQDKELENGNESLHQASFGNEYRRREGERERRVHSAFKVAQHDETYYDPDNGGDRNIGGVDISDRMNYMRYGPELSFLQKSTRLSLGLQMKAQLWDYEETVATSEYDHEYFLLRLHGQYKFAPTSLLRVTLEGFSRRFSDRPSYDLDGRQRLGNPNIRYDYYSLGLTARQRIFDSLWFGIDVKRRVRTDQYVGYNDYDRDSFGLELHWTPTERFDFEANGIYRLYNFPNAFAFNNPVAGRKTQESAEINLLGTFQMTRHLSIVGTARYRETVSNDTRIQYERNQFTLSVLWEQ
jgi:hypothetical protein